MSYSKPEGETSGVGGAENGPKLGITLPKAYGYLTLVQAGTAVVFSTFFVTHLSVPTLAIIGGIDLANRSLVLGRVYYQNKLLEPLVVFGALVGHITAGIAKRSIKLYWTRNNKDPRKLTGEVKESVERITTDIKNEEGIVVKQKITTKTTTTITGSYISKAMSYLLPSHHAIGYILIPFIFGHIYVNRILPKRHFGDSSLINSTYVTLSLRKWPRSSYLYFIALIGLTAYHITSGVPAVYKVLRGCMKTKKEAEKHLQESHSKKKERILRTGVVITSIGLLTTGLLVIGGKLGKDPRIPLRPEYL
jgi:hypothetical protein